MQQTNPLDKLFVKVDELELKIKALKLQGWKAQRLGGDWVMRDPEGTLAGAYYGKVFLFDTEKQAWEALISAGA